MNDSETGTHAVSAAPQNEVAANAHNQPGENGTLLNLIAKMATDPTADMNKLERLIQLRDHVMAQEAKVAYDSDFVRMKPDLPKVARLHDNTQTKSKYAKLDDINAEIDPVLAKYGFGTSSKVIGQTETSVTMRLEVRHRSGHVETMELAMPIDNKGAAGSVNKTQVHGISSTITYIKRVGFCALLNISTGDDRDGNAHTSDETISVEQAAEIDNRLRAIDKDAVSRFLKWAKVEKIIDLPAIKYTEALKGIKCSEDDKKKSVSK